MKKRMIKIYVLGMILTFGGAFSCGGSGGSNNSNSGGDGSGGGSKPLVLSFSAPVSYLAGTIGSDNQLIAAGDLDGDGKIDIALADANPTNNGGVVVLIGKGDGTFLAKKNLSGNTVAATPSTSVALGDLDAKTGLDIVLVNDDKSVSIFLNNGSGTFTTTNVPAVGDGSRAVAIGDVDGDIDLDLVVSNSNSNNVTVLLNNGNGSFPIQNNYGTLFNPRGIVVSDFGANTSTGKLDIAVANFGVDGSNQYDASILLNKGDGTFPISTHFPISNTHFNQGITAGDFNGDGNNDLAVANPDEHQVFILLNNKSASFLAPVGYPTGFDCESVVSADFDKDGKLDLVANNFAGQNKPNVDTGDVSVLLGKGDGTFAAAQNLTLGQASDPNMPANMILNSPRSVAVGDFNGDGKFDIATANGNTNTVSVLINTSAPAP